jgi:hypothetical protein
MNSQSAMDSQMHTYEQNVFVSIDYFKDMTDQF